MVSNIKQYELLSSLVQNIIAVDMEENRATVVMQSDLMQKDFLNAAHGHCMNDCGVVTLVSLQMCVLHSCAWLTPLSSIHADIAYTLGDYLYHKFYPQAKRPDMDITNLEVTKALIAKKHSINIPQTI